MLMASVLVACAHTDSDGLVPVGEGLRFALRSPASFGQQVLLVQAATLRFGAQGQEAQQELLFHTEITIRTIAIVGSLPNGTRLFSIVWDGSTLRSEGFDDLFARIPPAWFIADLQIAQWPLTDVQAGFAETGDCFNVGNCMLTESADQLQRVLNSAQETLISVTYSGIPHLQYDTLYEHHGRRYQLNIETLDVETLVDQP